VLGNHPSNEFRISKRGGSEHDPPGARGEHCPGRRRAPDPATDLDRRSVPQRRQQRSDLSTVGGPTPSGTIEVNDVQPAGARSGKRLANGDRIVVIDLLASKVAPA
jgi:hypothetical protein